MTLRKSAISRKTGLGRHPTSKPAPRGKKPNIKSISKLKKDLWQACRATYRETTCFTCGRENLEGSNRQLGHYIASSLCSTELRYDLRNLRIQCYNCNINKSGNTLQFRLNLIRDHGEDYVNELWERNESTKGKPYARSWFENRIKELSPSA